MVPDSWIVLKLGTKQAVIDKRLDYSMLEWPGPRVRVRHRNSGCASGALTRSASDLQA